jgi:hypothetical protein
MDKGKRPKIQWLIGPFCLYNRPMDKKDDNKEGPEQDIKLQGNPFEDIRIWLGLLLLPVILFVIYSAVGMLSPALTPEQEQQARNLRPALQPPVPSSRGEGETRDYNLVPPEKAEVCDFSQWVGKPLSMIALQKLERPYTFYPKGSEIEPTGDPRAINIELDSVFVTKVWCG